MTDFGDFDQNTFEEFQEEYGYKPNLNDSFDFSALEDLEHGYGDYDPVDDPD